MTLDGWRECTLGDIAEEEFGMVDGPFGSNLPASLYTPVGVPIVRGSNLSLGQERFDAHAFVFVSEETTQRLARSLCKPDDIIFTKKGTLGQTGIIPGDIGYTRFLLSSNQMKLAVSREVADPLFVYYFVSSPESRDRIIRESTASGVPKINLAYLRKFPITLPPLPEQQKIARILSALDNKIELNRRMNRTLEAMAAALFNSWFVDFDPVTAKVEGRRPYGMNAETAALFPSAFQDSEIGLIPQGWRVVKLGEVCELAYGKSLTAQNRRAGNVAVFGSDGQVGWHDTALAKGPGIVIGRKGNAGKVNWSHGDFFPIDTTFYTVPRMSNTALQYLFHALISMDLPNVSGDSAVPGLNREMAYLSQVLLPPDDLLQVFERIVGNWRRKIGANEEESRTLASIRDTLLPKLLSGEIRVKAAKHIITAT